MQGKCAVLSRPDLPLSGFQKEFDSIVRRASSLWERLADSSSQPLEPAGSRSPPIDEGRLARWCALIAEGDWEKFRKRLHWDGIEMERLGLLADPPPQGGTGRPAPHWAKTLKEVIECRLRLQACDEPSRSASGHSEFRSAFPLDSDDPLPFEELMLPALSTAHQMLLARCQDACLRTDGMPSRLMTRSAYLDLQRSLLRKLVRLSARALHEEFSQTLPEGFRTLVAFFGEIDGEGRRDHYDAFVHGMMTDGMMAFYSEYPVLGRLIATTIDSWVSSTAEFLQRLELDLPRIQQILAQDAVPLGRVTELSMSVSDPHQHGRSVIIVQFESGFKVVYKPRSLELNVVYNQLLDWLNQKNVETPFFRPCQADRTMAKPFKVLGVLAREDYGWVEYLEYLPCPSTEAARDFYQRAGILLCLMHVLRSTDCHYENIVSHGEFPVLVDCETLMHHQPRAWPGAWTAAELESSAHREFRNSVIRTAMLPYWNHAPGQDVAHDISGLGSVESQYTQYTEPRWASVNTDQMRFHHEVVRKEVQKNAPRIESELLSPNHYLPEITGGFRQMYRFLQSVKDVLTARDGIWQVFKGKRVRIIARNTLDYYVVLTRSLLPESLRDGIDRSIGLDLLTWTAAEAPDRPVTWPVIQQEIQSLEFLDFPLFYALTDEDSLRVAPGLIIERYVERPSYDASVECLQGLNEGDLEYQLSVIRAAFQARVARSSREWSEASRSIPGVNPGRSSQANYGRTTPIDSHELLAWASELAREIESRAVIESDGGAHWIGFAHLANIDRFQLQVLDDSLWDGNCGIALFLAACDVLEGSDRFRNLTLGALHYVRDALRQSDTPLVTVTALGGVAGLSSAVYALVKLSSFLRESSLLEDGLRGARLIKSRLIMKKRKAGISEGVLEACLALLELHKASGDPESLDLAIHCGRHLVDSLSSPEGNPRARRIPGSKPLLGFSHASLGISYTLLRLYELTRDTEYLRAARVGIASEYGGAPNSSTDRPDGDLICKLDKI